MTKAEQQMQATIHGLPPGHVLTAGPAESKDISYKADSTSYLGYPVTFAPFPGSSHRKSDRKEVTGRVTNTSYLFSENSDIDGELLNLRAVLGKLNNRCVNLRCSDPTKDTREAALAWLSRQIKKLAAESLALGGTAEGWSDPSDVFADMDQITALRHDLAELTRADAPYPVPLPPGCQLLPQANFDPFAHGRYYSGKLTGAP